MSNAQGAQAVVARRLQLIVMPAAAVPKALSGYREYIRSIAKFATETVNPG